MTWQRIDEDRYIDDTLVTCAEYQLFIDEMRAQGKYYQPDHWTSYQFPEGQAKKPILGVRHADAVMFCEWLTKKDDDEWKFRLPIQKEADKFSINATGDVTLGYWPSEDYRFVWIRPVLRGAINSLTHALNSERLRNLGIEDAIDRDNARVRDLTLDLDRIPIHLRVRSLDIDFDHILARDLDRDRDLALALDRTRQITSYHLSFVESNRINYRDITIDFENARDIYAAIFTLQERIAGRSPAFEGIRLVKERIR